MADKHRLGEPETELEAEGEKVTDGQPELVLDTVDVKHSVGLELPVLDALGQWDSVGEVVADKHRLGEPEMELDAEGE